MPLRRGASMPVPIGESGKRSSRAERILASNSLSNKLARESLVGSYPPLAQILAGFFGLPLSFSAR